MRAVLVLALALTLSALSTAAWNNKPPKSRLFGKFHRATAALEVDAAVDASAEAAVRPAIKAATQGLSAWWGPSRATVEKLNAGGPEAWHAAREKLELYGIDVNDIDETRFANAKLSAAAGAMLKQQLEVQHARQQTATERRRLGARATLTATDANVCAGIVAELRRWAGAHHNVYPTSVQASPQILLAVATSTQGEIDRLWDIVVYRAATQAAWNTVCNANALVKDLRAVAIHNAGGYNAFFAMGLEEEHSDLHMNPDSDDVDALAASGVVPGPRTAEYVKLCPDHKTAPSTYVGGGDYGVIEFATGPLPIHDNTRRDHRAVVDRFFTCLPAPIYPNREGVGRTLTQCLTAFSLHLPGPIANYDMPLLSLRGDHADFTLTNYPNDNKPYNSVQVNFEASLCAMHNSAGFLALNIQADQRDFWTAAREVATNYVTDNNGIAGVTAARILNLPTHQQCELKGLFTVATLQALYWSATNTASKEKKARRRVAVANLLRLNPHATDREKRRARRAVQELPIHVQGGTSKNFYGVLPKVGMHNVVAKLPFPLSDVVHDFYTAYMAGQGAVHAALHALLRAALNGKHANVAEYRGYMHDMSNDDIGAEVAPRIRWLRSTGGYWKDILQSMTSNPPDNPRDTAFTDHYPPAFIYNNGGNHQVQIVCEIRYQNENLNRAITLQGVTPPVRHPVITRDNYRIELIADLAAAATDFRPQGPIPVAPPLIAIAP